MRVCSLTSILLLLACFFLAKADNDILSALTQGHSYNRYSLIQSLNARLPAHIKDTKAMDLEIVSDFARRYFNHEEVSVDQIKAKFASLFQGFRREWVDDMVSQTMRAIGIDMDNQQLVKKIRENPKAYSIDYNTYRILTFVTN